MKFKYLRNVLEAQDYEYPIADLCWSPNNAKLAVATYDRLVLLFDRDGQRRDKFSTKSSDPNAGKKSYVITAISFNETSELLGIAQSDNMVFVYRVGADWGGKKVICNKFPLSGAPMHVIPGENGFITGTSDGKIRNLDCKSNKSSSLWSAVSCCVSLARGGSDAAAPVASGHVDGTIYLNGRLLLKYALPPTALVLLLPYLIVGSCDGRISLYEAQRGSLLRSLEPTLPPDRKDIITASASPSGQTVVFGIWDGCLVGSLKEGGVLELTTVELPNLYAVRSLSWTADGTKLAIASQTGAVILLEAVLRRWVWRESVEIQHVSPRQLVVSRLANDAPSLTVSTKLATEIFNVRIIGNDWYAVCRTANSLILCDIARSLTSEIPWVGVGERVFAEVGGACLLHRAGELSLVQYGLDRVLHTVRTERVNPHVLSVRINEARGDTHCKRLACLLDRQTVAVMDLTTGGQLGQWWHEARIDWLELNESGELLLFRDTRRRLGLLRIDTGDKEIIASGVGFIQWIENSDAFVAQTPTHLLIWYSAWETSSVEMCECTGAVREVTNSTVHLDTHNSHIYLDKHRLAFNNALRSGDLSECGRYLDSVGNNVDLAPLWRLLAERALADNNIQLAAKCYREVGDEARTFYLDQTVQLASEEGDGDVEAGLSSPLVLARLAMFTGDLSQAEELYKRADQPHLAVQMYQQFNKWPEAISLAERVDRGSVEGVRARYLEYLRSTGRGGAAGAVCAATGDLRGAVADWLGGGRARRAAAALLHHPALRDDTKLTQTVLAALVQEEWWEMAGELSEKLGDTASAVEYYAKGNNYARAVQLAREACPSHVTRLERGWGRWLVSSRQPGAAVPHLIEAGDSSAALDAALAAHHYKKALQILQVIDDKDSIKEQCEKLADHYISIQEWETAERVLVESGMSGRCVVAYNEVGKYAEGLRLAARALTEEQTREIYLPLAQTLREQGQLRKAEQIYVGLGEHDEAISMYKEASQYDSMVRLVAAHRPSLLEATRRHVAQQLHAAGDRRAAETYYMEAGWWQGAVEMYVGAGEWERAERVARVGGAGPHLHLCVQWACTLSAAAAARLLAQRGYAHQGAQHAMALHRWDIAYELSSLGSGMSMEEVSLSEAEYLSGTGRGEEAEAAYVRAGAADRAVQMWINQRQYQRALALADQHASHMVEEVLVEGAQEAADRGDLAQFEALMIRANRPREVVQYYKDLEMWEEAGRVSREYLPDSAEPVPPDVPPLLQHAAQLADNGEWWGAVEGLVSAARAGAAGGAGRLAERAALRAARLARDHLHGEQRVRGAHLLRDTFIAIGQREVGEQLKAALIDGQDTPDEDTGSADGEVEVLGDGGSAGAGGDRGAAERLARAGHWERALAVAGDRLTHYALRYSVHILHTHPRTDGIDFESEDPSEATSLVIELLRRLIKEGSVLITSADEQTARQVCSELLVRLSLTPRAVTAIKEGCEALVAFNADERVLQAATLLLGLHVPQIASRVARTLPRYTDIMVADATMYVCGGVIRSEGAPGACETFVIWNRCLDLVEAADEQTLTDLDFTDTECTDWPTNPLLLESATVRGAALEEAREWVLAASMDQAVDQNLPLDERGLYECSVAPQEPCCVLTGLPLKARLVTFANGRCANREWWARVHSSGRSVPVAAQLIQHLTDWCGHPDYTPL